MKIECPTFIQNWGEYTFSFELQENGGVYLRVREHDGENSKLVIWQYIHESVDSYQLARVMRIARLQWRTFSKSRWREKIQKFMIAMQKRNLKKWTKCMKDLDVMSTRLNVIKTEAKTIELMLEHTK